MRFRMFWIGLTVLACGACDGEANTDGGTVPSDVGTSDAGGPLDAGRDANVEDAGAFDAGPRDAGDAGDTGSDAGSEPRTFMGSYPLEAPFPEGGIYDPAGHQFFVGSLGEGSVRRVDAQTGAETRLFVETAEGTWWTLGMDLNPRTRQLFVCAMDDRRESGGGDPPYDGYVWVFDADTGTRLAVHDLADVREDATCTDVAVAEDNDVYITDRENPRIYRLTPAGVLSVLAEDDILGGSLAGLNGVVVLPDQSALLAIVYLPSRLVHIRLSDGSARQVDIDGDFFDGLPALSGADGIALDGSDVLVAFTSQLNRVSPTLGDWSRATSTTIEVPSGQTDIVATPGGPYLLNGQAVDFAFGSDPDPFQLVRVDETF
ncbi:MAG: hypothetical protein AB8I08_35150 [Sandaracinaceae bacterium]